MSSSFPPLDAWRALLGTRLGIGVSVALLLHGGALLILAASPESAPRRPGAAMPAETPELLRLSTRLQQQRPRRAANLDLSDLLPPPPPPPSLEMEAASAPWPWFGADQLIPATPASAVELSLAWIPADQRRGGGTGAASVELRRRQLWLTPAQAAALDGLWERGQRSSEGPDGVTAQEGWQWRLVSDAALQRWGLPPRAHGFTLLDGRQLQLVWRQRGQTWLLRLPSAGSVTPLTNP